MWLRDRSGTEPSTARSATGARFALSLIALPVAAVAAALLASKAMSTGREVWAWEAAIAAVVALLAAVDLIVLWRRRHR
jgi:hypothetical protein